MVNLKGAAWKIFQGKESKYKKHLIWQSGEMEWRERVSGDFLSWVEGSKKRLGNWKQLQEGWFKFNVDRSAREKAGIRVLVRFFRICKERFDFFTLVDPIQPILVCPYSMQWYIQLSFPHYFGLGTELFREGERERVWRWIRFTHINQIISSVDLA